MKRNRFQPVWMVAVLILLGSVAIIFFFSRDKQDEPAQEPDEVTGQGTYLGVDVDGKTIRISEMSLYRVESGKITEWWYEKDMLEFWEQLGHIEDPLAQKGLPSDPGSFNSPSVQFKEAGVHDVRFDATGLFCQPVDHAVEDEVMKRQYQKPIEPAPYTFGPEGRLLDQLVI